MTDPVAQHAFNRAVTSTLGRAEAISDQRGGEYQDSWAIDNMVTRRLDAVLRLKGIDISDREWKRLLLVSSLCDVKTSRWIGQYRADTPVDEVNYLAALAQWLEEYVMMHRVPVQGEP